MMAAGGNKGRSRRRYDGQVVTEQPTTAKHIIGSLSQYADPNKPANAYETKERLEHDRAIELGHIPPEPIRDSVREALHTVAMECSPFTPSELAEFEKIATGTKTTEQYRAEVLAEIDRDRKTNPEKYGKEFIKKQRK